MNGNNSQSNRRVEISYLRIFATISVIWLHTCSTLAQNSDVFVMTEHQQIFFNFSYHIMYWAVPVFFMISGSLLLKPEKEISSKQCITKYCRRIIFALFLFGFPLAIIKIYLGGADCPKTPL